MPLSGRFGSGFFAGGGLAGATAGLTSPALALTGATGVGGVSAILALLGSAVTSGATAGGGATGSGRASTFTGSAPLVAAEADGLPFAAVSSLRPAAHNPAAPASSAAMAPTAMS